MHAFFPPTHTPAFLLFEVRCRLGPFLSRTVSVGALFCLETRLARACHNVNSYVGLNGVCLFIVFPLSVLFTHATIVSKPVHTHMRAGSRQKKFVVLFVRGDSRCAVRACLHHHRLFKLLFHPMLFCAASTLNIPGFSRRINMVCVTAVTSEHTPSSRKTHPITLTSRSGHRPCPLLGVRTRSKTVSGPKEENTVSLA